MKQQVKPQQIIDRVRALVNEQQAKGYKVGWVWHQMEALCDKRAKNLIAYRQAYRTIPFAAKSIAKQDGDWTYESLLSDLQEQYDQYLEYEKEYA